MIPNYPGDVSVLIMLLFILFMLLILFLPLLEPISLCELSSISHFRSSDLPYSRSYDPPPFLL